MKTVASIRAKLAALNVRSTAVDSIDKTKGQLLTFNRKQLLAGKRRDGMHLSPTYFEDPFFKTPEAALHYSQWKDRITPNPLRPSGVPNLFINGYYHSSLTATVTSTAVQFNSQWEGKGPEIENKYGPLIYGVGYQFKQSYLVFLKPVFFKKLRDELQL